MLKLRIYLPASFILRLLDGVELGEVGLGEGAHVLLHDPVQSGLVLFVMQYGRERETQLWHGFSFYYHINSFCHTCIFQFYS